MPRDPDKVALLFSEDSAARAAAEITGTEAILLVENYSRKTGYYGMDPHTYRHDVMPLVAAIVVSADHLEALRARGVHPGELGRTTAEDLKGWERDGTGG